MSLPMMMYLNIDSLLQNSGGEVSIFKRPEWSITRYINVTLFAHSYTDYRFVGFTLSVDYIIHVDFIEGA